ncbi:3-hydroxyacyl-CoA dehydrogenase [Halomonas sp. V046]|uniref:3-hydroxyacyl-CoA dehydrogenase n=1 Tax=Halomonas sp. V046 TaxID=3459611 RepID=UPI004044A276
MTTSLNRLTVIGAGVLGGQIAWHSAYMGKDVMVYDINEMSLERCRAGHEHYGRVYALEMGADAERLAATQARLRYSTDLAAAVAGAELVIEAVPEVPAIKNELYARLATLMEEQTILATNSSTFLPAAFAEASGRPERYCALHFANLIWKMNVAEVMAHAGTSLATLEQVTRFAIDIGMLPVPVGKENNGYLLNAWLVPLLNACQTLVTNGVGSPELIDRTYLKVNPGGGMGPFGFMDVIGIGTCVNILAYWGEVNRDAQMLANAEYLKHHFLDQGHLGLQTQRGFYRYPGPRYLDDDFLAIPDAGAAGDIARRAFLGSL